MSCVPISYHHCSAVKRAGTGDGQQSECNKRSNKRPVAEKPRGPFPFHSQEQIFFFWHQWAQVSIHISPPVLVWVVKSIRKFPWMATGGLAVKSSPRAGYHHQACGFNLCCVGYTYNKCYQHWIYSLTMYTPAWCSVEKGALRALNQILRSKSWLIEMD